MRLIMIIASAAAISGCAELNSIQYTFDTDKGEPYVATIDAKQRVIVASPQTVRRTTYDASGKPTSFTETEVMQVCAEQSPDVFSMFSSSTSLSGEYQEAAIKFATALVESGGSMAMRTQLTQLQSNFLYNLCALSAAEKLSDAAVRAEMRRFQQTLLATLAIEQVTTPYRSAPQITVSGQSASSLADGAKAAAAELDAAEKTLKDAEAALTAAETARDTAITNNTLTDALEAEVAKKQKEKDKASDDRDRADLKLKAIDGQLSAYASGRAETGTVNVSPESANKEVAAIVKEILEVTLNRGALLDNCQEFLYEGGLRSADPQFKGQIAAQCLNVMTEYAKAATAQAKASAELYAKAPAILQRLSEKCGDVESETCKAATKLIGNILQPPGSVRVFSQTPAQ